MLYGPGIIARTMSEPRPFGPSGVEYQYHSRSDHHSKLACWAIAFDLLATSSLLRKHVEAGVVTIGVNHRMRDFKLSRKKDLDLVIARPSDAPTADKTKSLSLADLAAHIKVRLTALEQAAFDALPSVSKSPVGAVLVALEAKACMTEHGKSEPRLYDELNSSQQTVHGAADAAIAVGLAMVNIAPTFVSPGRQTADDWPVVTVHKQPAVSASVIKKLRQLPKRTATGTEGFDALGIMVVDLRNDGSPVTIFEGPPAPQPGDGDSYADMILRTATLYDFRYASL